MLAISTPSSRRASAGERSRSRCMCAAPSSPCSVLATWRNCAPRAAASPPTSGRPAEKESVRSIDAIFSTVLGLAGRPSSADAESGARSGAADAGTSIRSSCGSPGE